MPARKILLVDDEPLIRETLSRELTSENLRITQAGGGRDAVEKIAADYFDLVVSDLQMPEIDGFQVLEAAKQRDPLIKFILLTGYGNLDTAIDAMRLGADDFLEKPCDIEELHCRISSCLEKRELQRKVALYENFLPVCSYCKKVWRDPRGEQGKGRWLGLEEYFLEAKGVSLSHGCCPDCLAKQLHDIEKPRDAAISEEGG
jgi:YesN/AraC family two-component response regulator